MTISAARLALLNDRLDILQEDIARLFKKQNQKTRDDFAGQALQGFIARGVENIKILKEEENSDKNLADIAANRSYFMADAMMKARGES